MVDGIKWIELLIKGIVVGYIASIPLGPIGVICIQRTLSKGKLSGFVSGLGASTADTFLSIVAGLGLSFIIDFVVDYTAIFKLLGGILVIFLGFRIFFKNPVHQFRRKKLKKNNLYTDYISTLVLTLSNPLNIFLFLAIFAGLNIIKGVKTLDMFLAIFLGVFIGTSLWWFTLSSIVNIYHDKFKVRNLWWLNKITGTIIIIFGLVALISILFEK